VGRIDAYLYPLAFLFAACKTDESNLTEKQKIIKEELSMAKLNLKSVRALQIREAFQQIYVAESTEISCLIVTHLIHLFIKQLKR
jgi:hypothetical protein